MATGDTGAGPEPLGALGQAPWAPWAEPGTGPTAGCGPGTLQPRPWARAWVPGPRGPCAFALAFALALAKDPLAAPVAMYFHKKGIEIT